MMTIPSADDTGIGGTPHRALPAGSIALRNRLPWMSVVLIRIMSAPL